VSDNFQKLPYGLNQLPAEPPDDPNALFSTDAFASATMQRAGQKGFTPTQSQRPTEPPDDQNPLHSPNDVITSTDYDDAYAKTRMEIKAHGGLTYVTLGEGSNYQTPDRRWVHRTGGFYARLPNGSYAYFPPGTAVEQSLGGTTQIIDRNGSVLATYGGS
jgi:hypothetical protein